MQTKYFYCKKCYARSGSKDVISCGGGWHPGYGTQNDVIRARCHYCTICKAWISVDDVQPCKADGTDIN